MDLPPLGWVCALPSLWAGPIIVEASTHTPMCNPTPWHMHWMHTPSKLTAYFFPPPSTTTRLVGPSQNHVILFCDDSMALHGFTQRSSLFSSKTGSRLLPWCCSQRGECFVTHFQSLFNLAQEPSFVGKFF